MGGKSCGTDDESSSTDLVSWSRIAFSVGIQAAGDTSFSATNVGVLSAFVVPTYGVKEFYRLTVR